MAIDLAGLLADPPIVHGAPMGLSEQVAHFLSQTIKPGHRTLETGSGLSTLVFALAGAEHTVVVVDPAEETRIRGYATRVGLDLSRVHFEIGRSQDVLPALAPRELDAVLIDGRHGFPAPYIDWYYAGSGLKPGGLLVVDDTDLWTGYELARFLRSDPDWELVADFPPRTIAFRRLTDAPLDREWNDQPRVRRMSHWSRAHRISDLVRQGDRPLLQAKVAGRLKRLTRLGSSR